MYSPYYEVNMTIVLGSEDLNSWPQHCCLFSKRFIRKFALPNQIRGLKNRLWNHKHPGCTRAPYCSVMCKVLISQYTWSTGSSCSPPVNLAEKHVLAKQIRYFSRNRKELVAISKQVRHSWICIYNCTRIGGAKNLTQCCVRFFSISVSEWREMTAEAKKCFLALFFLKHQRFIAGNNASNATLIMDNSWNLVRVLLESKAKGTTEILHIGQFELINANHAVLW